MDIVSSVDVIVASPYIPSGDTHCMDSVAQSITYDRIPCHDRDPAREMAAEPEQFRLQRYAATRSRSFIMVPLDH